MDENRSRISRTFIRIFMVITCIGLAIMAFPIMPAQPSYNSQALLSAGVLLNKPDISYDLSLLDEFEQEGSVNTIHYFGSGNGIEYSYPQITYYIYRSHFNDNLGVLIFEIDQSDLSINESEKEAISFNGLSVNIVIPIEDKGEYLDPVFTPAVPIDPETLDWGAALRTELGWLLDLSIITGLTHNDINQIEMHAKPGQEEFISMVLHENTTWRQYLLPDDILKRDDIFGEPLLYITPLDIPANSPKAPSEHPRQPDKVPYSVIFAAIIVLVILGIFSYTRLKRRLILDNLNRKNIFEHIKANPGIHFKKILRELNFQPGAMSYHLNVLEKGEFIKSIQDSNYRRFYLYGTKSDFKIAFTTIQLRILSVVNERPGISQVNISKTIGKNRMVVNYHVKLLVDAGVLTMEKSGRESLCYITSSATHYLNGQL